VIRIWIETASTVARAGFETLLEGGMGIELAGSPRQADVVLRDDLPEASEDPGSAPTVVLSDEHLTSRLFRCGVHAILPRDAAAEQIVAALYAAAAGLVAVPAQASGLPIPAASESEVESLTPREMEALEMLAEGLSNKEIAARLHISTHTAKFHVNSILGKLGAGTRTEAVIRGLRSGLVKV
jgi:two-component system, NarL family, nitrate/nitrite response regulator NarL